MDLIALADALLLPADDLALAAVLRSPLFGFSDEDLFAIAADRGRSLAACGAQAQIVRAGDFWASRRATRCLARSRAAAIAVRILRRRCSAPAADGRSFHARLGAEANDALDEFLNLALDYERREIPSLQGFVAWLRAARAEVKRDMEIARDEVRVMTVHGAKGLEAPIVILADTMTQPSGPRPPRLLELADGAVVWAGRKDDDVPPVAAARAAALSEAEDEYRRLLYVAMTRAADRLIVCGADGERQRPKGCWYDLVVEPLRPFLIEEDDDSGEKVWRFRKEPPVAGGSASRRSAGRDRAIIRIPAMAAAAARSASAAFGADLSVRGIRGESGGAVRVSPRVSGRAAQGAGARPHRSSADAIVAGYSAGGAQGRHRALSEKRGRRFCARRTGRDGPACAHDSQRPDFRRSVRAGKPRRGADRRPARARGRAGAQGGGAGGSARRDPRFGADRRLQNRPGAAERARRGAGPIYRPARALPRRPGARLPGENDSHRTHLHRGADRHRASGGNRWTLRWPRRWHADSFEEIRARGWLTGR